MKGATIWLNQRVLAPKYYWKAVCDPVNEQSIFFYAENNIGNVDTEKDEENACAKKAQTKKNGVIMCLSISAAKEEKLFGKLPDFHNNCKPSEIGSTFMKCIANARFF